MFQYMNGHSDVLMGSVSMKDASLYERVKFLQFATGPIPSPFDCYLVNRSLKTLKLRWNIRWNFKIIKLNKPITGLAGTVTPSFRVTQYGY